MRACAKGFKNSGAGQYYLITITITLTVPVHYTYIIYLCPNGGRNLCRVAGSVCLCSAYCVISVQ